MPETQEGVIPGQMADGTASSGGCGSNGGSQATRLPPLPPSSNWSGAKSVLAAVKAANRFQTLRGKLQTTRPACSALCAQTAATSVLSRLR